MTPNTAVIYARCAQQEPANETAITEQLNRCTQMARTLGATVVHQFIDRSTSGTDPDRPGLQRMLAYVEYQPVDYAIAPSLSAIARTAALYDTVSLRLQLQGTYLAIADLGLVIGRPSAEAAAIATLNTEKEADQ